ELVAASQAEADMLGLVVAGVLGLVTVHGGDMVAVQVMGGVESLQAGAGPGNDRARPEKPFSRTAVLPASVVGEQRAQPLPVPGVQGRRVRDDGVHDRGAVCEFLKH